MSMIIDGLKIANEILAELKKQPKPTKSLVAVFVGDNPASVSFLKQKEKTAKDLGIDFKIVNFPENVAEQELVFKIKELNIDQKIGGIIIQLPVPAQINRDNVISALDFKKDIDNLKGENLVPAPAVAVVEEILRRLKFLVKSSKSVVIGRGQLVGEPITYWLKKQGALVSVVHTEAFDEQSLREADLVVSGAGQPGLVKGDMIKKGAILIDFGYTSINKKISGDFEFSSCSEEASAITPTPGGTGPILVAKLFGNFYRLTTR